MRNHIVTFEAFDVVVVPFPFTDKTTTKRRPALVLSEAKPFNKDMAHSVLAMITSASHSDWPLDIDIEDIDAAGLPFASIIRMKLFTLDDKFIIRKAGSLGRRDRKVVANALQRLLPISH
jgi:mRNA interferase MazF